MKPISTTMHGAIDYMTGAALIALPQLIDMPPAVAALVRGAGVGALAYSAITDYELGAVKLLPMKGHLALDAMSGATFLLAPLTYPNLSSGLTALLMGIGAFELGATFLTEPTPYQHERFEIASMPS
jgi:hypothetical protein